MCFPGCQSNSQRVCVLKPITCILYMVFCYIDKELFGVFQWLSSSVMSDVTVFHIFHYLPTHKYNISLYELVNYILGPGVENQSVLYYTSKQQQQKNLWKIKLRKQNSNNSYTFSPTRDILPSETGCSLSRICQYILCWVCFLKMDFNQMR